MSQDHAPRRLRALRWLSPAAALRGTGPAAVAAAARVVRPCPRRRGHLVAGLRGPPLHAGLPPMSGPPNALLAGRPATVTQPPGSAAASSDGGGSARRCPPERRERIVGAVDLNERPREATRLAHRATSPSRLPGPDPSGGSEHCLRPSAALPGAEGSCCQAPQAEAASCRSASSQSSQSVPPGWPRASQRW
jgi:hypothetical protein